jgi:hypothetical protein
VVKSDPSKLKTGDHYIPRRLECLDSRLIVPALACACGTPARSNYAPTNSARVMRSIRKGNMDIEKLGGWLVLSIAAFVVLLNIFGSNPARDKRDIEDYKKRRAVDRYNESVITRVLDEAEVEKRRQEMNKELNKQ